MTKRTRKTIATIGIAAAAIAAALAVGMGGGDRPVPSAPNPSAPAEAGSAGEQAPPSTRDETAAVSSPVTPEDALELLTAVSVEAPRSVDYDREDFGSGWIDVDGNGCSTRNDILNRDLTETTHEPETNECVVLTGTLDDPYTGAVIDFTRGQDTSSLVQIDHLIPLSWAAQQGALDWDRETREQFANDPRNLLAVDGPANASKGDSGPSEWLPEAAASHCGYAARFVIVLDAYKLTTPAADHDALGHLLTVCTAGGSPS